MRVFDIKRYSINDGPGIRTTIFTKGCPLRCIWCHNPESWQTQGEWIFKQGRCIGCNTCGIHPHQLESIRKTTSADVLGHEEAKLEDCPTKALELCGREWTAEELMTEVEKERSIMEISGGGVTVSGGEPLMHVKASSASSSELLDFLKELGRRGFHRALDTTLYASDDVVRAAATATDLFLVDLKVMDDEKHRMLTGVSNKCIHENIRTLAEAGATIQFRIPLIVGVNADEANIEATAAFIDGLHIASSVALLPYHEMGREKHKRRGTEYNPNGIVMSTPSDAVVERSLSQFASHGITCQVGG